MPSSDVEKIRQFRIRLNKFIRRISQGDLYDRYDLQYYSFTASRIRVAVVAEALHQCTTPTFSVEQVDELVRAVQTNGIEADLPASVTELLSLRDEAFTLLGLYRVIFTDLVPASQETGVMWWRGLSRNIFDDRTTVDV